MARCELHFLLTWFILIMSHIYINVEFWKMQMVNSPRGGDQNDAFEDEAAKKQPAKYDYNSILTNVKSNKISYLCVVDFFFSFSSGPHLRKKQQPVLGQLQNRGSRQQLLIQRKRREESDYSFYFHFLLILSDLISFYVFIVL